MGEPHAISSPGNGSAAEADDGVVSCQLTHSGVSDVMRETRTDVLNGTHVAPFIQNRVQPVDLVPHWAQKRNENGSDAATIARDQNPHSLVLQILETSTGRRVRSPQRSQDPRRQALIQVPGDFFGLGRLKDDFPLRYKDCWGSVVAAPACTKRPGPRRPPAQGGNTSATDGAATGYAECGPRSVSCGRGPPEISRTLRPGSTPWPTQGR